MTGLHVLRHPRRCKRKATVRSLDGAFCTQHDPENIKNKRDEKFHEDQQLAELSRIAFQNEQIGVAVRKLFIDGTNFENIMRWVNDEQKWRGL